VGGEFLVAMCVQLVIMILQYIPRFYVIKEHIKSLFLGLEVGTFYIYVESLLQSIIIQIMWKSTKLNITKSIVRRSQLGSLNWILNSWECCYFSI
jgi:hypothetical protein